MANRPISYPKWVSSGPNVSQPSANLAATGWGQGTAPDAPNVNWQFGNIDQWIEYLDQLTNTGIPLSVVRLINGGTWSFDATTGSLAWSADANLAIPPLADSSNDIPAGSVTMADGQVAYAVANLPSFSQGNTSTTSNPNQITGMNFTGNVSVGNAVTGPGIAPGTTVLGVGTDFVTLSQDVTSDNTGATYAFAPTGTLTVQVVDATDFDPTVDTILLGRRAGAVVYLGVNCAQMVLRDGEFKTLIGSGYFSLYQAPAGQDLTAGTLVYVSPGASDGGRTQGGLYPLDVSVTNQAVRGTYAGVVVSDVSSGQSATVLYSGFYAGSALTAGAVYYADPSNPGGITKTQPTGAGERIEPVAFALTATTLLFTGVASSVASLGFPIFAEDDFSGNGSQTAFVLSNTPVSASAIMVFVDGAIVPQSLWSFDGLTLTLTLSSPPAAGQSIEARYVLASQSYLAGYQEAPTNPSGDRITYQLSGVPANQASTLVFVDNELVPSDVWTLSSSGGHAEIVFNAALSPGQTVYACYFTSAALVSNGGGGGSVSGAENEGSGVGVFDTLSGSLLKFFSLVAGTNVTIAYDGSGGIKINATGSGSAIEAHGSYASPQTISPSAGLSPSTANDQVWWAAPSSGGATAITANPQIAAGTTIGQRLTLKGASATNYYTFADGNGLRLNGPLSLTDQQACELMWDGSAWSENSRRV